MPTSRLFRGLLLSVIAVSFGTGRAVAQGDVMGGCCLSDYAFCLPMSADACREEPLNLGWQEGDVDKCTRDLCCVPDGMGCLIDADCCAGSACGSDGLCKKSYCCIRETNALPRLSDDPEYLDQDGVDDCMTDPAIPGVQRDIVFDEASCTAEVYCCNPNTWLADQGEDAQRCTARTVPTALGADAPNPCENGPYDGFVYTDAADCMRGCGQSYSCIRNGGDDGLAPSCARDPMRITLPQSAVDEAGDAADVIDARNPDAVDAWLYRPYLPSGDSAARRVYDCVDWCVEEYPAVCNGWCTDDDPGASIACDTFCPGFRENRACGEDCQAQCRDSVCLDAFRSASQCEAACGNPDLWEANIGGGGMRAEPPWPGFPNGFPAAPESGEKPAVMLASSSSPAPFRSSRSPSPSSVRSISSLRPASSSVLSFVASSSQMLAASESAPVSSDAFLLRPAAPDEAAGWSFPWWLLFLLLLVAGGMVWYWISRRASGDENAEMK